MPKKWEYGIVHINGANVRDAIPGSLWPDTIMSMNDVKKLADEEEETAGYKGTYPQDKWLGIAGKLGWELCCSGQDQSGLLWYFKREL
ncbi:MAG TPA: hypothetical protein VGF01_04115 [Terracidiphilus sp.]|jgi:hypothetical protein